MPKKQSEELEYSDLIPVKAKSKTKKKRASRSKIFSTPNAFNEELKQATPDRVLKTDRRRSVCVI